MAFRSLFPAASLTKAPLVLECLLCSDKFTVKAVEEKKFFLETNICKACYVKAQETKPQVWCFGKLQTSKAPGFSQENESCRLLCPDRKICKTFVVKLTKEKERNG